MRSLQDSSRPQRVCHLLAGIKLGSVLLAIVNVTLQPPSLIFKTGSWLGIASRAVGEMHADLSLVSRYVKSFRRR